MNDCEWVAENGPDLVRGDAVPEGIAVHIEGCADCRSVTRGAETLRVELDAWEAPEPADDLLAKTLARLALAQVSVQDDARTGARPESLPAETTEPASTEIPEPTPALKVHARRRSSIMILTGTRQDEVESAKPPTGKRLFLRLCTQAAAAVLLFTVCTAFVAVFYPAVTFALEDRRVKRCQKQLARLAKAAVQYHKEHPDSQALHGGELRRALITGGYADEMDFVCTGHSGEAMGARSYVGLLPAGSEAIDAEQPIYWDRFANHSSGFNVVYPDGHVETVSVDKLATWRRGGER